MRFAGDPFARRGSRYASPCLGSGVGAGLSQEPVVNVNVDVELHVFAA